MLAVLSIVILGLHWPRATGANDLAKGGRHAGRHALSLFLARSFL